MFESLLIANRGEIAVRIIRTCRKLGIRPIAVYSEADRDALHVRHADAAFAIGPAESARSYLDAAAIVAAAQRAGAEAIHPGYGFLAESETLIAACEAAGIVFVGPHREAIRAMGSKIESKAIAERAGVPVVPGYHGGAQDAPTLAREAERIGYPLLIKASAGGGGRGMRRVDRATDFAEALVQARAEALAGFGDDRVLLEKLVTAPRHIEVQIAADRHGQVVHLFERECSIQRNHQKVIEEAPAAFLSAQQRAMLHGYAVALARVIDYDSLGTVEFLLDNDSGEIYFLEMNTRLQVEHPVTEYVTGLDLVEWQLRSAAGELLPLTQNQITCTGWAIEARVNAEDPARGYRPGTGTIALYDAPTGDGIRVDSGVGAGSVVTPHYDSLLAKVIAGGADRVRAQRRRAAARGQFTLTGPVTNLAFLGDILRQRAFSAEPLTTGFLDTQFPGGWTAPVTAPDTLLLAALAQAMLAEAELQDTPWRSLGAFRLLEPAGIPGESRVMLADAAGTVHEISVRGRTGTYQVEVGAHAFAATARWAEPGLLCVERDGHSERLSVRRSGDLLTLDNAGAVATLRVVARRETDAARAAGHGDHRITATLPGQVAEVRCAIGDSVRTGDVLVVLDSMKLLHPLAAAMDGRVRELFCVVGDSVEGGATLVELDPVELEPVEREPGADTSTISIPSNN
jgi:3-methylcrotonyl-CoA carboxylase alpha subunit